MAQIEQAQATLALHGLEGFEGPDGAERIYEGPRNPDALLAHVGHEVFRPGQREGVEAALDGRDALIVMPTGGGKSLCYQLPGLASPQLTIVVSPLIALMADQVRALTAAAHPAVMVASGLSAERNREALARMHNGRARIAYCSPERFGSTAFLDAVTSREVDLMAIDEAHCVSEWGHVISGVVRASMGQISPPCPASRADPQPPATRVRERAPRPLEKKERSPPWRGTSSTEYA